MSEEEIIDKLNNLIRILDKTCESGKSKEGSYIQGLLDLYTKQKQDIEELKEELEVTNKMLDSEVEDYDELEENSINKDIIKDIIDKHYPEVAVIKFYELLGE